MRLAQAVLLALTPWGAVWNAFGVAYRLPNQDPEAISRGNAFVATADSPAAIYYNPAGITQLDGQQFQAGLYFVNANIEFRPKDGGKVENQFEFQPVPELYYTVKPKEEWPVTFGLGVFAPYGLGMRYETDSAIRPLAIRGKLLYATVEPVVAWKVCDSFSVSIGPTLNYSTVKFRRGIGQTPGDFFEAEGDGYDTGFAAGARWQPHEKLAFGASYHFETTIDYQGHSILSPYFPKSSTTASIRFPQFAVAGVSYRPTPNWNLEFNADWTDWDRVNQTVFKGTRAGDLVFPFEYHSSWMYEFGVSRNLPHGYVVGAGYFFSEASSPDKTFNPIIPDADLHLGSVGFGRHGEKWSWYMAYHFALGGRTVSGNLSPLADGTYDLFNQAFSVSIRRRF